MFSQRNNPYCDLLLISVTKIVIYFVLMSNLWKNINIFDEL
ncbi:hypothetical protein M089_4579 [Bacteroides ovatus str. 3725 D9 iii]|nr:hypothetical protein M088_4075 [Bacteroides ovatus str. 3725 D1 iv]KDS15969.1 hypothetical protein M082_4833 [Bacteroides fragilis str. 3725 D9 ii]KDS25071.1 hypothetical protein M089_4579 [Bacteroides ovatus str. 3725 D9 iii]CAG9870910.1 hypothetical protein BOVAC1_5265 [Bacteroides ovatus]